VKRLLKRAKLEGRKDDTEEVILNLMNVYQKQNKFEQVKGVGSIDDIFDAITQTVEPYLK